MSGRRAVVAAVVLLGAIQLGGSTSAIASACHVISDPRGDTGFLPVEGVVPTAGDPVDVLSGDIASDARALTVAIRLVRLARPVGPGERFAYDFYFDGRRQTFEISAELPASGRPTFEVSAGPSYSPNNDDAWTAYSGTGIGRARGVVDWADSTITMTTKLRVLKAARVGTTVSHLRIRTWRDEAEYPLAAGYREDLARTSQQYPDRYRLGDPSCLAVGSPS